MSLIIHYDPTVDFYSCLNSKFALLLGDVLRRCVTRPDHNE
jgi:hypothetical protein